MSNNTQKTVFIPNDDEHGINIKQIIFRYLRVWPWFLLSVVSCAGIAYIYAKYQTPIYKISAKILVNDPKKGGMIGQAELLGDMGGLLNPKSIVDNEVEVLKTHDLIEKVVKDMKLNITYYSRGRIRKVELYESPFNVEVLQPADTIKATAFEVSPLDNGRYHLTNEEIDTVVNNERPFYAPGVGTVQFFKNPDVPVRFEEYELDITSVDAKVASLLQQLSVNISNKQVTIIDLDLTHPIPKKGEDILNKLIEKYVQGNVDDKNLVADSTIKFIQNRVAYIGGELGDLEGNIQGFRERNRLADMSEQSRLLVQNTGAYVNDLAKVETQLAILTSLEDYLRDDAKNKRVLPSSILPEDMVFNGLIERYNALLLERDRRLLSVTSTNPFIQNLDQQIANLRIDMLSNIENTKRTLTITRNGLRAQVKGVENKMQQIPETERSYLDLARQQQIKQGLYIFLMQKSEETAISKTSNIANSKTIDSPKSASVPLSPQKLIIYMAGLMAGIFLPIGIVYISDVLNNKVTTKEDITHLTGAPIVGEISHNHSSGNLAVADSSRSAIAEQFRSLRTNLSFFLKAEEKVILLTSSMSGEGKSFAAINLGHIISLSGKKVLLMELDLRKPGLSVKLGISGATGYTNYMISSDVVLDTLLQPLDIHPNLFLMSSGPLPPNPAEILMSERMDILLSELKERFDYIIIDAPPIGIVTDAQLLARHIDMCLYLIRHKYTSKEQVNIVQDLYLTKKMNKLGIIINDVESTAGYGYGYSYGAYGNEVEKTGIIQKVKQIFKK